MKPSICSSCVILFFLLASVDTVRSDFLTDMACGLVKCGEGTCKPTNSFPGVHCECNSGWKEAQVGNLTLPLCVPNCSLDFGCGGTSPPAPLPPLNLNFSDPCALSWCIEGTCVAQGTGHICQCNAGADNLMNNDALPCFKECVFGADCNGLGFGVQAPPPTKSGSNRTGTSSSPPPTPIVFHSIEPGPNAAPNSSSTPQCFLMLLLAAIYATMF